MPKPSPGYGNGYPHQKVKEVPECDVDKSEIESFRWKDIRVRERAPENKPRNSTQSHSVLLRCINFYTMPQEELSEM